MHISILPIAKGAKVPGNQAVIALSHSQGDYQHEEEGSDELGHVRPDLQGESCKALSAL